MVSAAAKASSRRVARAAGRVSDLRSPQHPRWLLPLVDVVHARVDRNVNHRVVQLQPLQRFHYHVPAESPGLGTVNMDVGK